MSESRGKFDLTTGSILQKLVMVAVPIMGTQFMLMTYNLVDMFWLGRLGSGAVAAAGAAGMYMWLANGLMMMGRMGAEIGCSQNFGRGDMEKALQFSQNAFILSLSLGLFAMTTIIVFRIPLVRYFGIEDMSVASDAVEYLMLVALGMPFQYTTGVISGTFNGSGNSRISFFGNSIGLLVNVIMDPLLIFTFNMGVAGAALATVFAQFSVMAFLAYSIKRGKTRPFTNYRFFRKPDFAVLRQIFKWSIPISMESMFYAFLSMTVTKFIAEFGYQAMAASRIGGQIESLSWLIGGGYGSAVTAFVGQNYGAGKWKRIRDGYRSSLFAMVCWGAIVSLILYFGGKFIFMMFIAENEVIEIGIIYAQTIALAQIPANVAVVPSGTFKGIGQTIKPSIVTVSYNVLRVVLAYFLARTSLGLTGIFYAYTITSVLGNTALFIWYFLSSRKHPKIDESTNPQVCGNI
ncbi:MAG: MATE family efflux transporter [Oscillospiraceae bacterium]|nr:MATE family efflux transporter [Oscillospiraceae bacterium]